jgi:hypothetical protein
VRFLRRLDFFEFPDLARCLAFSQVSASYFWQARKQVDVSLGSTLYSIGNADIDLTAQGVCSAGKFDKNHIVLVGGTARYTF